MTLQTCGSKISAGVGGGRGKPSVARVQTLEQGPPSTPAEILFHVSGSLEQLGGVLYCGGKMN